MFADVDNFRHRKTLTDSIERKLVVNDMPIGPGRWAHQVFYADADVEGARNRPTVAHLAKDNIALQLHFHLFAAIDAFRKANPESRSGDIQDGSIKRFTGTR